MNYIIEDSGWQREYQKTEKQKLIWIRIVFSDDRVIFLDEFKKWLTIKDYCKKEAITVKEVSIQYATHRVTERVDDCDGVYVIRSLKGEFGQKAKNCYTIGKVFGNKIHKKTWLVPELMFDFSSVDDIENSFAEAIVYHEQKRKT